ncbi:hypothetical protein KI387_037291, partial [Taxus chinensis]
MSGSEFRVGTMVLKWDARAAKPGNHKSSTPYGQGPFKISTCKQHNAFKLETMEGDPLAIP